MNAVSPNVKSCLFTSFTDGTLYLLINFFNNFLDSSRVYAAITDQPLQGQPRYLAANRIESRENHSLGRVVDDQINTGCGFDGPDIAPLAPNYPSFHLFVGKGYNRNGLLRHIVPSIALYG